MFAGVDPGNCQTSVSKKCLEPASCSCDGPGGKRRRRTSCLGDVFCLQDKVGTKQLCDRSTHSGQVRCPRSSASASANTSHPTDSRTPTRPSHWWERKHLRHLLGGASDNTALVASFLQLPTSRIRGHNRGSRPRRTHR